MLVWHIMYQLIELFQIWFYGYTCTINYYTFLTANVAEAIWVGSSEGFSDLST